MRKIIPSALGGAKNDRPLSEAVGMERQVLPWWGLEAKEPGP
ncbi:MAG TPA: hypothetical protein VN452_05265 [Longilinea sp.]|nr:hypothetical protein [Longilinea sp.]